MDAFTSQYINTALWASSDEHGEPLDLVGAELSADARKRLQDDAAAFQQKHADLLEGLDPSQCGHDFWLTRNRHGAGFWDRGYPKGLGDKLTEAAHAFGECSLYIGDDGLIHIA